MTDDRLTKTEIERYKRQLMHEGFGLGQQAKLKNSTVLVAGVGGLGGAATTYLAAAGIGRLRIVHYGNLTLSNMNRQTLMKHAKIGSERVAQARDRIRELNPDVEVEIINERITEENIDRLLSGVSIALSARPNFAERRLLNMACVAANIPMVEAAMNGMEGYIFNVVPGVTPCLNCLYPADDPEWRELGFPVFGAVSGTLGCIMAMEAIKLMTGFGKPLLSCMLSFDLKDMDFRKRKTAKDPECIICSEQLKTIAETPACESLPANGSLVPDTEVFAQSMAAKLWLTAVAFIKALGRDAAKGLMRPPDDGVYPWYEFK